MEHLTLLIKPASSLCNMRCKYCFYNSLAQSRDNESYGIMNYETAENIIKQALKYATKSIGFAFQGGEPALAKLEFYELFIDKVKFHNSKGIKISYSIQTNGLDISDDFIKFFKVNNFLVGLSIDGYKEVHDYLRVDSIHNPTHSKIIKTARRFEKAEIEFNILTVVTSFTAKHIKKSYNFYKSNGFRYLQFIPCLDPLDSEPLNSVHSLTPVLYEEFLKTLFVLYYEDFMNDNYVSIRFFDNLIRVACGQMSEQCGMLGFCSGQFVIEADGSVFPCDFYCVDNWKTGNINENTFNEIYNSEKMKQFIATSNYDKTKCNACQNYDLCKGGCRRDRDLSSNGTAMENIYCEALFSFYTFARPYISKMTSALQYHKMRHGID